MLYPQVPCQIGYNRSQKTQKIFCDKYQLVTQCGRHRHRSGPLSVVSCPLSYLGANILGDNLEPGRRFEDFHNRRLPEETGSLLRAVVSQ